MWVMAHQAKQKPALGGLIEGRDCGACTVCCVALTIEDPRLMKAQGLPCPNLAQPFGCSIYETRPRTCREFHCGWRKLKWVPQTLRPDLSAVLVRLHAYQTAKGQEMGVIFTLLEARALQAEGLAEAVAAAVASDIPTFLHIPGPPGYTSAQTPLNDAVREAVRARDKPLLLDILRQARDTGLQGRFVPLELYDRLKGTPA